MPFTSYVQADNSPFHAVVAEDGIGEYTSVQEAINAAPENRSKPWIIFIKNGSYEEQVVVPSNKPYIHLIGQDKYRTVIHLKLNVGGEPKPEEKNKEIYWSSSIHNPESPVYKFEGAVFNVEAPYFYAENISFVNDYGVTSQNGPMALAMKNKADCASFNNCVFRSFQDTWQTSSNDQDRLYVKDCFIEGAVDYFFGGGDALLENCTLYNTRKGSVIVAPCQTNANFGYVFRNCIIDGNELAMQGGLKLGRPWHNSPKAVFIHSTIHIPIAIEGWTDMGGVPALFAEYDSRDTDGNVINLNQRKTDYTGRGERKGSCRAIITKEEADSYVYERIISRGGDWNPRVMMEKLPAPKNVKKKGMRVNWKAVPEAIGYVLYEGEIIIGFTKSSHYFLSSESEGKITVRAVNYYGSLGREK